MPWVRYIPLEKNSTQKSLPLSHNAKIRVIGGTTGDCMNTPVTINALRTGAIAKVPVVLAEFELQLNIDAVIDLPEFAWEIKDIKKNIKVTQCLLLQETNMLFIKGHVQKNIQYTTNTLYNIHGLREEIHHCTADIPFGCTTSVTFNGTAAQVLPIPSSLTKFKYCDNHVFGNVEEKDHILAGDLRQHDQISTEYYNELPYCELASSRIVESEKYLNYIQINKRNVSFDNKTFKSIEEKMVVYLTVKILQKRPIAIPPVTLCAVPDEGS